MVHIIVFVAIRGLFVVIRVNSLPLTKDPTTLPAPVKGRIGSEIVTHSSRRPNRCRRCCGRGRSRFRHRDN